ncbi:MAG TPA: CocE/NonD family hydrolase, partial [Chthonomonadaceae bacterium]|nr:CocE/NonD family hydrolase [Chthonomonadaceae bacterium]
KAPTGAELPDQFRYDPRDPVPTAGGAMIGYDNPMRRQNENEARADVLTFSTPALGADIEVTGPIRVFLNVATSAPCTDFTGLLVDVYPDGAAYNISEGVLRRRFRAGQRESTEITLELWPTSTVFRKGHRIRLDVSSSNYPRLDRNTNTGRDIATEMAPVVADQTLRHDLAHPSRLVLPIIPGG